MKAAGDPPIAAVGMMMNPTVALNMEMMIAMDHQAEADVNLRNAAASHGETGNLFRFKKSLLNFKRDFF